MPADGTQEYGASFPGCVRPVRRGGVYHKWLPLRSPLYWLFFLPSSGVGVCAQSEGKTNT